MKKTMIAVFAVLAAASIAKAGNIVDFDGKNGTAVNFSEMIKAADFCQSGQPACSQPKPVPSVDAAAAKNTFSVSVGINNADNSNVSGKDMLCAAAAGQLACRDKSTGQLVNKDEIPVVLVEAWWTRRSAPGFISTKSPYTTCSSGHEFDCEDYCKKWVVTSYDDTINVSGSGVQNSHHENRTCEDWSYKCSDQGAGTCSEPTTPPHGGFHHPDED